MYLGHQTKSVTASSSLGYANLKRPVDILATQTGMSVSDLPSKTFYQMVKTLAKMTDSSLDRFMTDSNLQVSNELKTMMNTTNMLEMARYYPGILSFVRGYNFTLEQFLKFVTGLDSPQKSQLVLTVLGKHDRQFFLTNNSIAAMLNITAQNLTSKQYLTDLYPSLKKVLPVLLNKTTRRFIYYNPHFIASELRMTPEAMDGISPGSVKEGYLLRLELALDLISDNITDLSIIQVKIKKYYGQLVPVVGRYFERLRWFLAMSLKEAKSKCNISDVLFWNMSISRLGEICLNLHFDAIAQLSGLHQRELLENFKFSEVLQAFNVTKEHILSLKVLEVERLIYGNIEEGHFLHGPIIAEAYKREIPISEIPDSSIMGLAMRILDRPEIVIRKWFKLTKYADQIVRNTTFRNFPKVIKQEFNETLPIEYMYAVSFVGLMEDVLVRKNVTDLKAVFVDTSRLLATHYNWVQLQQMYVVDQKSLMESTVTSFFAKHTSASEKELKKIFRLSDKQFNLMNKIKLKYAGEVTHKNISRTEPLELKDKLVRLDRDVNILFDSLDELIKKASLQPDILKKLSFVDLLQKGGKIPQKNITKTLSFFKNNRLILEILKLVPVKKFAVPLKMNMVQIRSMQIFELLKSISQLLSSCK